MKQVAPTSVNTTLHPSHSKEMIDAFLRPLISLKVEEARTIDPAYATLWQAIESLYLAGGKRFRSYMTLLVFEAYSNEPLESIIPSAAAQELLHLAMLIHDDIIDRDFVRYGVKNVASQYLDHYQTLLKNGRDKEHFAQSAAMLSGDLLISEAFILITETQANPSAILSAQRLLSKAIFNVIGGELLDTEASFKGIAAAHPLIIAEQKTASYSFVTPFLMGAALAEAPQDQRELLQTLGQQVGIAYQLRDDVIGVFGNEALTGKSAEGDIREGKRTVLIDEFYRRATPQQRTQFDNIFGNPDASSEEVGEVRQLLIETGAKASLEEMIETYYTHTTELIDQLTVDDAHKEAFRHLIQLCLQRER